MGNEVGNQIARTLRSLSQQRARMHFQHRREMESTVALLERQRAEAFLCFF